MNSHATRHHTAPVIDKPQMQLRTARRGRGAALLASGVALLCCLTPVLVVGFSAIGASALNGGIDYVAWPLFALTLLLAWLQHRRVRRCEAACARTPPGRTWPR